MPRSSRHGNGLRGPHQGRRQDALTQRVAHRARRMRTGPLAVVGSTIRPPWRTSTSPRSTSRLAAIRAGSIKDRQASSSADPRSRATFRAASDGQIVAAAARVARRSRMRPPARRPRPRLVPPDHGGPPQSYAADRVGDAGVARSQFEDPACGSRGVEQGDEDRGRVVAGDLGAFDRRWGEQHPAGAGLVGQLSGTQDGPVQPRLLNGFLGGLLGGEVGGPHLVGARPGRVVDAGRGDQEVAAHARGAGGVGEQDGGGAVDGVFAGGTAAGPGPGGEDHGVRVAEDRREVVDGRGLQVEHDQCAARLLDVGAVSGIADDRRHAVGAAASSAVVAVRSSRGHPRSPHAWWQRSELS